MEEKSRERNTGNTGGVCSQEKSTHADTYNTTTERILPWGKKVNGVGER